MLLDERGRLLGRINIIDLGIVIIVPLLLLGFFAVSLRGRTGGFAVYELKIQSPDSVDPAKITGQTLYDTQGRVLGEITAADGDRLTVRAAIRVSRGNILSDGAVIKAGRSVEATAGDYYIKAVIERIYPLEVGG